MKIERNEGVVVLFIGRDVAYYWGHSAGVVLALLLIEDHQRALLYSIVSK